MAKDLNDKELLQKLEAEDKANYYPNGDNKKLCNYAELKDVFNLDGIPIPTTIKNGEDQGEFILCMNKIKAPNHFCEEHKENENN